MFDHVKFGVSDYAASKAFFLKALESIGIAVVSEGPLGVELGKPYVYRSDFGVFEVHVRVPRRVTA